MPSQIITDWLRAIIQASTLGFQEMEKYKYISTLIPMELLAHTFLKNDKR
jgi:hypothetical protein